MAYSEFKEGSVSRLSDTQILGGVMMFTGIVITWMGWILAKGVG
jgi:hypothetical protein